MSAEPLPVPIRRWPRRTAYGLAGLAVLVPTSTASAGWYFANQVVDARPREYPLEVRGFDGDLVTLTRTEDTERDVPYGLLWPDGHARLGGLVRAERDAVVRQVTDVTRGTLRAGVRASTSSAVFDGDPLTARGLAFEEVTVPGDLGPMPAWLVPGASSTWVIAVHGRGGSRAEALRVLPTLAESGLPTLAVTYRNDEGAPPSPDRRYHLGATEWRDVAAAIRYARSQGASDVILYGWSMGGAAAMMTLRRAPEAAFVRALVMDCPALDWTATLRLNARRRNLPTPLAWAAMRLVEQRVGVPLADLNQVRHVGSLRVPTLIFLDGDDVVADPAPTRLFARLRPDLVRLVETRGGGHTRSWNVDPARYEAELAAFVGEVAPG
ncbi:alpha/beta hydrolase family protein [Planosporangium mesophilum]|uniref:Alpha/beta hydrolase n=1 Tax=Planosporangium mesophilum TaxID=689768 RepID=A0A8J3TGW5_9ACTN|nr:alpha/beta fold hydrolase [Planosporangium mesophilum]NJC83770.1 alpha/beta hydrolase [Planosporangium mesophilum]GII26049.1 alpha/beta hydrolase [Planosporangium mesophilum]